MAKKKVENLNEFDIEAPAKKKLKAPEFILDKEENIALKSKLTAKTKKPEKVEITEHISNENEKPAITNEKDIAEKNVEKLKAIEEREKAKHDLAMRKKSVKQEKKEAKKQERAKRKQSKKEYWKSLSTWQKTSRIIGQTFDYLFLPILICAIFLAGSLLITKKTKGVPMCLGYTMITVVSGSMVDAGFQIGSKAFIKQVKTEDYKVGDYIAFFDYVDPNSSIPVTISGATAPREKALTSRIVFHEIVDIHIDANDQRWFQTKGTNNSNVDINMIHENYVIGRHIKTSQGFMGFIDFMLSIKGTLVVIVLPCTIILFKDCFTLVSIYFDTQDEKKRKKAALKASEKSFEENSRVDKDEAKQDEISATGLPPHPPAMPPLAANKGLAKRLPPKPAAVAGANQNESGFEPNTQSDNRKSQGLPPKPAAVTGVNQNENGFDPNTQSDNEKSQGLPLKPNIPTSTKQNESGFEPSMQSDNGKSQGLPPKPPKQ